MTLSFLIYKKINIFYNQIPRAHKLNQSNTPPSSEYPTTTYKVTHNPLQSNTAPSSKYHIALFKVPHRPLQSTTPPSSKYHITLFKVPQTPLQNTKGTQTESNPSRTACSKESAKSGTKSKSSVACKWQLMGSNNVSCSFCTEKL